MPLRRFKWPQTLFARLMLIWIIGICVVLVFSYLLLISERGRHDADVKQEGLVREIAGMVDILDKMPAAERQDWLAKIRHWRWRIRLVEPEETSLTEPPENIRRFAKMLTKALEGHEVRVLFRPSVPELHQNRLPGSQGPGPHRMRMDQPAVFLMVTLHDGSPLTVLLPAPLPDPGFYAQLSVPRMVIAVAAILLGITLLSWLAVAIAVRPLSRLAEAVRAFGNDPNQPDLRIGGPVEVKTAAQAFNEMQYRIRRYVDDRNRILVAISHDLQTPITRLMLRAEMVDDEALKGKIQEDLLQMQSLVREGLDYAKSMDVRQTEQVIDINSLLEALCDDAQAMGWQVNVEGHSRFCCRGSLTGLRRALWNLLENGVKFGGQVRIVIADDGGQIVLAFHDAGPGLPPEELEKVFEPFYRGEQSRNRGTGGTGLGLAIARNLLRAQGGDVSLANAPQESSGLVATVTLRAEKAADRAKFG